MLYYILSQSHFYSDNCNENAEEGEDEVNPWDVKASSDKGVDYAKLIVKFGSSQVDEALLARFEAVTKENLILCHIFDLLFIENKTEAQTLI